jgi:Cof subfamily protein (haloacid dehalogenase superfamily)
MSNIKMIVMDLDGTLLTDEKNISNYTLSILEKCKNIGIKIVIATARSERSSKRFTDILEPDYIILNGGVLVKDDKKIICRRLLPKKTASKIINEIYQNKNVGEIKVETETDYYLICDDEQKDNQSVDNKYSYLTIKEGIQSDLIKIRAEFYDENIIKTLTKKYTECEVTGFTGEKWYRIVNKGANKINGIKSLMKETNISMENIIAFGDDYNDMEMIRECGVGIAMENGIDEIKRSAKYICGNNNEDGVGKWIEKNVL